MLLDPISGSILRVPSPPTRLCLPTPQLPTFRLATGALSTSDSRIRPKPLPTDRARSLPGLWHGDSFIVTTPDTLRWRSDYMDWVTFRKQRWVTLRARQSVVPGSGNGTPPVRTHRHAIDRGR